MMGMFARRSIAAQAAAILALILAATLSALAFWAHDNALSSELQHSRTVADMADAFRALAASHGGFYIRREAAEEPSSVGRALASYSAVKTPDGKEYVFAQKNPFLAIGDYSSVVLASPAAAKFRITSDNNFNPANQPDAFDLLALQKMRDDGAQEVWDVVKGRLRYARALRAEKSCLACHGAPEDAPPAVKAQYRAPMDGRKGGGYGYEEGEIVGVTSVVVPHLTLMQMLMHQSAGFWLSAAVVVGLLIGAFVVTLKGIVRPLRELARYSSDVASERLEGLQEPRFDEDEMTSNNEIHRANWALKTVHEAMLSAITHIQRTNAARHPAR